MMYKRNKVPLLQKKEKGDMIMPLLNIPNISAEIKIKKEKVLNLLLASIAFEQFGLSSIINAEVKNLQYILNNFENNQLKEIPTVEDLIQINRATRKIFRNVINNHILLQFKLDDILDVAITKATTDTAINDTTSTTTTKSASCSPVSSCEVPVNKGVSVLAAPLLHNNVHANRNIAINDNSIFLSRNSNVIKTRKSCSILHGEYFK